MTISLPNPRHAVVPARADQAPITTLWFQVPMSWSDGVFPKSFVMGNEAGDEGACAHTRAPGAGPAERELVSLCSQGAAASSPAWRCAGAARQRACRCGPAHEPVSSEVSSAGSAPGRSPETESVPPPRVQDKPPQRCHPPSLSHCSLGYKEIAQPLQRPPHTHKICPGTLDTTLTWFLPLYGCHRKGPRCPRQQGPIDELSG